MRSAGGDAQAATKRVLVVGDWLVDDHWVVAEARSKTASRIGKSLFRSLQGTLGSATSLCGAGRTASILIGATRGDNPKDAPPFEVAGIGTWHLKDTNYMHTLLEAYRTEDWEFTSVYQRSAHSLRISKDLPLLNVATLLPGRGRARPLVGTTTIVRIYQRSERNTHLRERIDFELRAPGRQSVWLPALTENAKRRLATFCSRRFDAVVVKDLGKGTVSTALISELAKLCKDADWFVSSKAWNPDWLLEVPKGKLRLLMIPEMATLDAVRQGRIRAWTTPWGSLTREALSRLDLLLEGRKDKKASLDPESEGRLSALWAPAAAVVVSFDDLRVHLLARGDGKAEAADLFSAHFDEFPRRDLTIGLPFSSVLLPSMAANLVYTPQTGLQWKAVLDNALKFTSLWRKMEAGRIHNPAEWTSLEKRYNLGVDSPVEGLKSKPALVRRHELECWRDSMSGQERGIIPPHSVTGGDVISESELQLWRATADLEDYVCCSDRKRTVIHRMLRGIREFMSSGARFHQGCILIAPPGSGKSFLIKCLANRADIRMLEPFNMTQISSHAEIYGQIFDKVHEAQQRTPDAPLLVFVDEINADHGKQPSYDAFLEPLQDGTYVSNGRRLNLAPCYWIFVSTKLPLDEEARKWEDFKSRLQDGLHFLASSVAPLEAGAPPEVHELEHELEALKLENVYLGIRAIRNSNPWVTHATRGALDALYGLRVASPILSAETRPAIDNRTLVAHLRGIPIAGDTLRREHLVETWLTSWSDGRLPPDEQDDLVRIRAVPPQVP